MDTKKKASKKQTKKKASKKIDERFQKKPVPSAPKRKSKVKRAVDNIKGLNRIELGNGFSVKVYPPRLEFKKKW